MLQAILTHAAVGILTLFIFVSFIYLALRRQKLSILFASSENGELFYKHPTGKENLYKVNSATGMPTTLTQVILRELPKEDLLRALHTKDPDYLIELMKSKYPGLYTNKKVADSVITLLQAFVWARHYARFKEIEKVFSLIEEYVTCMNSYLKAEGNNALTVEKKAELRASFSASKVARAVHRLNTQENITKLVQDIYIPWN